MRSAVLTVAMVLALAVLRPQSAEAHPAALAAARAAASRAASAAGRGAMRAASKISRMRKMVQRARKGMGAGMKPFGSLNRLRDRMKKATRGHRFDRMRNMHQALHKRHTKLTSRRNINPRHNVSTFAKRQLQNRSFAQQLQRRTLRDRMQQFHRSHQRRSSADRNDQSAESQRSRMRRNAASGSRGVLASALAR